MMNGEMKKKGWIAVWGYRRLFSSGVFDEGKTMAMATKCLTLGVSLDDYEQSFCSPIQRYYH
jgi:hypothetical protein